MKKLLFALLVFPSIVSARNITFSIPDDIDNRVIAAMAYKHGYEDTIQDANGEQIPNPETKAQFVLRWFKRYCREITIQYEAENGGRAGFDTSRTQAETDILIP